MIYCYCYNSFRENEESHFNLVDVKSNKHEEYMKCNYPNCQNYMHRNCFFKKGDNLPHINCIQCILRNNDPLRPVLEILTEKSFQTSAKIEFTINKILYDKFLNDSMTVLEIRCIRLQSNYVKLHEQVWPNKGFLCINDKDINHFMIERRRKDLKYQTREHIKLGKNWIIIDKSSKSHKNDFNDLNEDLIFDDQYYIGIYVVTKIEKEKLLSIWRMNNLLTREKSINLIKERFMEKKYSKVSKIIISLNCSIDQQILHIPARGVHCRHITCFSLMNLIVNNQKYPNQYWNCPICKLPCYQIVIDSYLEDIVNILKAKKLNGSNVIFYRNGFYEFRDRKISSVFKKEPITFSDEDNNNLDSPVLFNNLNKNSRDSSSTYSNKDEKFGIEQLIKDIEILIERCGPIMGSNDDDLNDTLLTIPNILTFESLTILLGLVPNKEIVILSDLYSLISKCLKGFDKVYSIIKYRFSKYDKTSFLSSILKHSPKNTTKLAFQILGKIALLFIKEISIETSQAFWLCLIRSKTILSPIEEKILRFSDNVDNFHDRRLRNPFKLKINYFGIYEKPTEFNSLDLKLFDNVSSKKLNWAQDYELGYRERLWKILWDSKTRWFKVKVSEKIQNLYNQDPYSVIYSDDIKFLMSRIMYLRQCWIEDMKDHGDIPRKIDKITKKVTYDIKPLEFFITPEKLTIEKFVHINMDASDTLGDGLSFINANPVKSFRKPCMPISYEKLKMNIINNQNIDMEEEVDIQCISD